MWLRHPSMPEDYYEPVFPTDSDYYRWRHLIFDKIDGKWICQPYKTSGPTGYLIYDEYGLDGGGRVWGWEFPFELKKLYPQRVFQRCLDWCSGPGYCGFEMLDHGLCQSLALIDLHDLAIDYANISIEKNNCQNLVSAYNLDAISKLPLHEKFDLVIGNPPHSPDINLFQDADQVRILSDQGWNTHREFFDNIGNYLTDDGVIWLCENINAGAGPVQVFQPMIEKNGFKIKNIILCKDHEDPRIPFYYMEIIRA